MTELSPDKTDDAEQTDDRWGQHFQAGLEAIASQQYSEAATLLSQALIEAPESELAACYATRAYAYLCLEDFDRSIDDSHLAIQYDPTDGEPYAWRGSSYAGQSQWRESLADFQQAIQLCPENAKQYRQVAVAHTDRALEQIRAQVKQGESSAELFFDRAVIYAFRAEWDKAIRDFSQAIDLSPKNWPAYMKRAECNAVVGNHEDVILDCTRAIKRGGTDASIFFLRGCSLLAIDNGLEAISDMTRVIKMDAVNAMAHFHRGRAHASTDQYSAAIDDFTTAIQLDTSSTDTFVERGKSYVALNNFEAAVDDFTYSLDQVPADSATLILRGDAFVKLKSPKKALQDFDDAIALDAICPEAYRGRGTALAVGGEHEAAIKEVNKALRLDSRYTPALISRGKIHYESENVDEARADFSKALEVGVNRSDAAEVHYYLAIIYRDKQDFAAAIEQFGESIQLRDDRPGVFLWRGIALARTGKLRQAIGDFRRAIDLSPENEEQYRKIGQQYCQPAIEVCTAQIQKDKTSANTYRTRGTAFAFLSKPEEAIADFNTLLELLPNDTELLVERAAALMAAGKALEAVADFTKVLDADDTNTRALYLRGKCFHTLDRLEEALADFVAAIKVDESDARLHTARGEVLAAMGQADFANASLTKAIRLNCQNADAFMLRGKVLMDQGKYDQAICDFSAAVQLRPKDPAAWMYRGELYAKRQSLEMALRDFEAAIRIDATLLDAHCQRARMMARLGDYEAALIQLTKQLGHFESELHLAQLLDCRGRIYYSICRFQRAVDDFFHVTRFKPAGFPLASSYAGMGLAQTELGDNESAKKSFTKALKLDASCSRAKIALDWLQDPNQDRPNEIQSPTNHVAPTRPPQILNPMEIVRDEDEFRTDPLWDQWLVLVGEEPNVREYGPVRKLTLDKWCAEGRLDLQTSLLRADWKEKWRPVSDAYPELLGEQEPTEDETTSSPFEDPENFPGISL